MTANAFVADERLKMIRKFPSPQKLRKKFVPILRKYKIGSAFLFGSAARGDTGPRSDIDLILLQKTQKRFLNRYEGILRDLNNAFPDIPVEPLIYTPEELEKIKERPFIAKALKESILIYESA